MIITLYISKIFAAPPRIEDKKEFVISTQELGFSFLYSTICNVSQYKHWCQVCFLVSARKYHTQTKTEHLITTTDRGVLRIILNFFHRSLYRHFFNTTIHLSLSDYHPLPKASYRFVRYCKSVEVGAQDTESLSKVKTIC
jgi:hypothetical protein